jgi:3-methyladenine DNA glycosylase AlkD
MQFDEVLAVLKKYGDKRAVSNRHKLGLKTENYLGVNPDKIISIAKKTGKNHKLAEQLRKTGIRDAILLSFFVDEPRKISEPETKNIIRMIDSPDLSDPFSANIVANSPYALDLIDEWKDSSKEMVKRCAYMSVRELAGNNHKLEDNYFLEFLTRIERELGYSKPWVKDSMIHALNGIGNRNDLLKNKTAGVIAGLGKIKIDYPKGSGVVPAVLKQTG